MAKSIIQKDKTHCFLCGRNGNGDPLEKHHCIYGTSNRKHSDDDGLVVWLCGNRCHRNGEYAVHNNRKTSENLKQIAQLAWEANYGTREQFIQRYGKSWI